MNEFDDMYDGYKPSEADLKTISDLGLPADYIDFISEYNGGEPHSNLVAVESNDLNILGLRVGRLTGFPPVDRETDLRWLTKRYPDPEWPEGIFAIGTEVEEGGTFFISISKGKSHGNVFWFDYSGSDKIKVSDSFSEFVGSLISEDDLDEKHPLYHEFAPSTSENDHLELLKFKIGVWPNERWIQEFSARRAGISKVDQRFFIRISAGRKIFEIMQYLIELRDLEYSKSQLSGLAVNALAISEENREMIQTLIDSGADLNVEDGPLRGYDSPIELLVSSGADPNLQSKKDGATILHRIAKIGSDDRDRKNIRYLLSKGADKNIQNQSGETPYQVASEFIKRVFDE